MLPFTLESRKIREPLTAYVLRFHRASKMAPLDSSLAHTPASPGASPPAPKLVSSKFPGAAGLDVPDVATVNTIPILLNAARANPLPVTGNDFANTLNDIVDGCLGADTVYSNVGDDTINNQSNDVVTPGVPTCRDDSCGRNPPDDAYRVENQSAVLVGYFLPAC
jgi:hypothetical protein